MAELQRAANSSALQEKLTQMRLLAERRQTGAKPTGIAYPDGNKPSVSASELESHGIYKRFWTTLQETWKNAAYRRIDAINGKS